MDQEKQNEMQQKYFQLQMLDQQINHIQKQHKLLDDQLIEITGTKQNLEDLSVQKLDSEILAPISAGIFIKAGLKDNSKVIVNVGSNVAVNKPIPEAMRILDNQIDEIKEVQTRLLLNLTQLSNQAMALEKEINSIAVK